MNVKRQRRQAAAAVVGSLWNSNADTMGRKSTAQPRPELYVPPRGIGPIVDPNENDVLCGRGGRINSHPGNIRFRDIISANKKEYLAPTTKKLEKAHIAAKIVYDIRGLDPAGRFLKEDRDTGLWFDIGDAKAIKKTGQALREDAPDIRHELEGDSSGDEKAEKKDAPKAVKTTPQEAPKKVAASVAASTTPRPLADVITVEAPQSSMPGNWQKDNDHSSMMPPQNQPFNYQANPYLYPHQHQAQAFEGRMIPIQMPHPGTVYTHPNQPVSGVTTTGRRVANASRHAVDALSNHQGEPSRRPSAGNEAFGRQFYEPANSVLSGGGNTMSTISAISDPISSTIGNSALMSEVGKESALSGISGISGLTGIESARYSGRSARGSGLGVSGMGRSSRPHGLETMRKANSGRSFGSSGPSHRSDNMAMNIDDNPWKSTMDSSEEFLQELSGAADAARNRGHPSAHGSMVSRQQAPRDSSAMSIASTSTASTARWLTSMRDTTMTDDGRSVLSEMSAELYALDLAQP